jgi:hypothetical protein
VTQLVCFLSGVAGQLVLAGGGFMPMLLLARVGARLLPSVHVVAVVPVTAIVAPDGSGSRTIHLLARAVVPAPAGARLTPGVHVVTADPATAVVAPGGSGSRAIHLLQRAVVPTPVGARLPPEVHAVAAVQYGAG